MDISQSSGLNVGLEGNNDVESVKSQARSKKREDYLSWDEYFMASAFLAAQRSKDPRTQVGACIVNEENKIVGVGYNGMPLGCSDDEMPWGRDSNDILETKQLYVCHAELNAVLNKNAADVKNCRIYVALFPCNECAKVVIQSSIKEVIYYSDKYASKDEFKASRRLLNTAGITLRQFKPGRKQIVIDFDSIDLAVPTDQAAFASAASTNGAAATEGGTSYVAEQLSQVSVSGEKEMPD